MLQTELLKSINKAINQQVGPAGKYFVRFMPLPALTATRPRNHKSFVSHMRSRLVMVGQESDVASHIPETIKLGSVQLYRKIGMHDVWIMKRI